MEKPPMCFGRWISESANKCEKCSIQLECYGKMREGEKREEAQEALQGIPWYKRTDQCEESFGFCERCG